MKTKILGKTGLVVSDMGFGALPIQRAEQAEAVKILRRAFEAGVNFFDTARMYSDSEEKIGLALSDVRKEIVIATKSQCSNVEQLKKDFETSLKMLQTDYVDIFQFHNPDFTFTTDSAMEMYNYALELKKAGAIRHIGITAHKYGLALEHIQSGLFETLQYPISMLAGEKDFEVINAAKNAGMGIIAMKALSGGLITNARAAAAWMQAHSEIEPIWGIQHMRELNEFLELYENGVELDSEMEELIEKEKRELSGAFCRGCGYCLPCAADLPIHLYARLPYFLRRMPTAGYFTEAFAAKVERIRECTDCGDCKTRCPYDLDCPELLRKALEDFRVLYAEAKAK